MAQANPYPLRIDESLMEQLRKIADEEGRSINKEIEFIIRQYVKTYTSQNNQTSKG
jgi:hypothetical protein